MGHQGDIDSARKEFEEKMRAEEKAMEEERGSEDDEMEQGITRTQSHINVQIPVSTALPLENTYTQYGLQGTANKGHFLALDELKEKVWDSLDIFGKFFGTLLLALIGSREVQWKLRDIPCIFRELLWDTSKTIFMLSHINHTVCTIDIH